MSSLRATEEKYKQNLHRNLIKIAMVQACRDALKKEGEEGGDIQETLARHVLANSEFFFEKIYLLVLSDDRIDDNAPDSAINAVVCEVLATFEV
jgi:hypothetical protein